MALYDDFEDGTLDKWEYGENDATGYGVIHTSDAHFTDQHVELYSPAVGKYSWLWSTSDAEGGDAIKCDIHHTSVATGTVNTAIKVSSDGSSFYMTVANLAITRIYKVTGFPSSPALSLVAQSGGGWAQNHEYELQFYQETDGNLVVRRDDVIVVQGVNTDLTGARIGLLAYHGCYLRANNVYSSFTISPVVSLVLREDAARVLRETTGGVPHVDNITTHTTLVTAGNFSIGHTFLSYTATSSKTHTSYPIANLSDYVHPQRKWKSSVAADNSVLLDFGTVTPVTYLALYNTNFTSCTITGSDGGTSDPYAFRINRTWTIDERVNRKKVITELTGFNYRYLLITLEGATTWEIGNIVALASTGITTFDTNPDYGYSYKVNDFKKETTMETGNKEITPYSTNLKYSGRFNFGLYDKSNDADHFNVLVNAGQSTPVIFWENTSEAVAEGDKVYICYLDNDAQITWHLNESVKTNDYSLEEVF